MSFPYVKRESLMSFVYVKNIVGDFLYEKLFKDPFLYEKNHC